MPLRVMHLIGGGEIGGAEHHVLHLLKSLDSGAFDTSLACLVKKSPFASLSRSLDIQTHIFPMSFPADLSPLFQIVSVSRRNGVGLFHCHGTRANLIGRLAAKISGIPCISTVHSLPESDYTSVWKGQLALHLDNLTLPLSSGLITVSESLREQLKRRLQSKHLALPLEAIYNGVDSLDFSSHALMRSAFRQKWKIPNGCQLIGTIGRLHPVKGHCDLIEATKRLRTDFPDLHLLIIGEGPTHNQLVQRLRTYQIPYTLTGYLPDAWKALPAMDLFVLPSLSEGMGFVLLEAAQAKVPIVASRVGGIPEVLRDQVEALLVNPSNPEDLALSCRRILQDQALANALVCNASQRVIHFTIKKMTENTAHFYNRVLDNRVLGHA